MGRRSLGFEKVACDFDEGKIVTTYTGYVITETPTRRTHEIVPINRNDFFRAGCKSKLLNNH